MAWIHDTGYGPAYDHIGYTVSVLLNDTETCSNAACTVSEVIGWRAACECGWRGMNLYARREPTSAGMAAGGVGGRETGTAAFTEWQRHVRHAPPDLAVHDLARQLADTQHRLRVAVRAARFAGLSWSRIGTAAGTTPDDARRQWSTADPVPTATAQSWSSSTTH